MTPIAPTVLMMLGILPMTARTLEPCRRTFRMVEHPPNDAIEDGTFKLLTDRSGGAAKLFQSDWHGSIYFEFVVPHDAPHVKPPFGLIGVVFPGPVHETFLYKVPAVLIQTDDQEDTYVCNGQLNDIHCPAGSQVQVLSNGPDDNLAVGTFIFSGTF